MDDLISRQAAIDTLNVDAELLRRVLDNTDLVGAEREKFEWGLGLIESHIYDMEELPSAQPEPHWIPCGERLPEAEDIYIVAFDKRCLRKDEIQVSDAIWKDNQWQYQMLESFEKRMPRLVVEPIKELKVIAWMPLPEPYKGEES